MEGVGDCGIKMSRVVWKEGSVQDTWLVGLDGSTTPSLPTVSLVKRTCCSLRSHSVHVNLQLEEGEGRMSIKLQLQKWAREHTLNSFILAERQASGAAVKSLTAQDACIPCHGA